MLTESKKIPLYNPLDHDFIWPYLNDDNETQIAVVPSHEISYYLPWLANLLAKHIVDEVLNKHGIKVNHEDDSKKILDEVLIKL